VNISEIRGKSSFEQVVIPPEKGEPKKKMRKLFNCASFFFCANCQ
jgi:hypothetical protein